MRALVVDPTAQGLFLYPVRDGRVREGSAVVCAEDRLEDAARMLEWTSSEDEADWPWLLSWLHVPRRKGRYLVLGDEATEVLSTRVRHAL